MNAVSASGCPDFRERIAECPRYVLAHDAAHGHLSCLTNIPERCKVVADGNFNVLWARAARGMLAPLQEIDQ